MLCAVGWMVAGAGRKGPGEALGVALKRGGTPVLRGRYVSKHCTTDIGRSGVHGMRLDALE